MHYANFWNWVWSKTQDFTWVYMKLSQPGPFSHVSSTLMKKLHTFPGSWTSICLTWYYFSGYCTRKNVSSGIRQQTGQADRVYIPKVQFHLKEQASKHTDTFYSRQRTLVLLHSNTLPAALASPLIIRFTGNRSNRSYSLATGIGAGESLHLLPGSALEEPADCRETWPISYCAHWRLH